MQGLEDEIKIIMADILADKGVSIRRLMQRIANLEHEIYNSLTIGETKYLSFVNISDISAYKKPMSANYLYHDLWLKVFAQKYGNIDEPPYPAIKLSVDLSGPRAISSYLTTLDNKTDELFRKWLIETNKRSFAMFVLPRQVFENGVADDFTRIINKRHIISEITAAHYILLEICGMYFKNSNNTTMMYDDIPYIPEQGIPGSLINGD